MIKDAIEGLLVFVMLMVLLGMVSKTEAQEEDVRYCYDRSSYPTKVVVVCGSCQCPAGYY